MYLTAPRLEFTETEHLRLRSDDLSPKLSSDTGGMSFSEERKSPTLRSSGSNDEIAPRWKALRRTTALRRIPEARISEVKTDAPR